MFVFDCRGNEAKANIFVLYLARQDYEFLDTFLLRAQLCATDCEVTLWMSIFREFSTTVPISQCISLRGVRCGGLLVTTVCDGPEQRTRLHFDERKRVDGAEPTKNASRKRRMEAKAPCCTLVTLLDNS